MKPVISIGAQDFEFIRVSKSFFVDKTGFIKEWWENNDAVTLITRPRRFGKTLNLNMMNCFFSSRYAGRGDLFEGLSIWGEEKYRELQGTYPVIFLSFAGIKSETFQGAKDGIIKAVSNAYEAHSYLKGSGSLDEEEQKAFNAFKNYAINPSTDKKMPDAVVTASLQTLCMYLERYYKKKVIVLLDEYDTPLQEAYVSGYWSELVALIREMFNMTFKTNPFLDRALMTGITRVSKESIFSDLNNLIVVTSTSESYCTRFGFTEEEVFQSLDFFDMSDQKEKVKEWYDGFTFGSQKDIYNPWSITRFLNERILQPYWANSSGNRLVSTLIRQGIPEVKETIEDLLAGKSLETEIDEEIIFNQLGKKRGAIWSMLLASGYLKVEERTFSEEAGRFTYRLTLTNREVRLMMEDLIKDWFSEDSVPYNAFLKALLLGDVDYMNEYMNQIAEVTFSSFDSGTQPSSDANPERFYHGFVLGLIVELAGKYRITSNRESGFGRYDVMMEPLDAKAPAFVLEFKVRNRRREKTLEDTLQAALNQIGEKDYDAELIARGIPKEQIRHYGFAFEGKEVLIG